MNLTVAMLLHYVLTTSFLVRGDYVGSTHYDHVMYFFYFFDLSATYKSINCMTFIFCFVRGFAVVIPFCCFLLLVVTRVSDL